MPDYIEAARIETMLYYEHLADSDVRPDWQEAVWVANLPLGPDASGVRRLQAIQAIYGSVNVTTGNARPGTRGRWCGVYVRPDVIGRPPNPLRDYLSEED